MTAIHHRVTIETDDDGRSYLTTETPRATHTFRLPPDLANTMLRRILEALPEREPAPAVEVWC